MTCKLEIVIQQLQSGGTCFSFAHMAILKNELGSWIIDTGASDHMPLYESFSFPIKTTLDRPIFVHLPDGLVKTVHVIGSIHLNSDLLKNILLVLGLKHNLLSILKLLTNSSIVIPINQHAYSFWDQRTNYCLALAQAKNGLYVLEIEPFRCHNSC